MTVSDWQWARRMRINADKLTKRQIIGRIDDLHAATGAVVLVGPSMSWTRFDLVAYLAEYEETSGRPGPIDPDVLEQIKAQAHHHGD